MGGGVRSFSYQTMDDMEEMQIDILSLIQQCYPYSGIWQVYKYNRIEVTGKRKIMAVMN